MWNTCVETLGKKDECFYSLDINMKWSYAMD